MPQKGLKTPGNINLYNRPEVRNPDGSISTVRSMSIGTDEGEVLIPTVVGNKVVSNDEAVQNYRQTGQHLGIFDTPENATAYASQLHNDYAAGNYNPVKTPGTPSPVLLGHAMGHLSSYVRGTNYVPRTGVYKLHKGEAVIPSKFNPIHQAINGDNLMAQPKLGSGGRFAALKSKLGHQGGIKNPAALAAKIGQKKWGKGRMAKMAAAGRTK